MNLNRQDWVNLIQITIISLLWAKKSLSRNGVTPHSQQKNPKYSTWVQPQNNRMILVHFQGRPFNITVNQVYAPTTDAEATEVDWFYEDLEHLLELTPK